MTQEQDLLVRTAKEIGNYLFEVVGFYNRYRVDKDMDKDLVIWYYITFSSEGFVPKRGSSGKADVIVRDIFREYSFNVCSHSNKMNVSSGFGNHDEIKVIFKSDEIYNDWDELENICETYKSLAKYKL